MEEVVKTVEVAAKKGLVIMDLQPTVVKPPGMETSWMKLNVLKVL